MLRRRAYQNKKPIGTGHYVLQGKEDRKRKRSRALENCLVYATPQHYLPASA